MELHNSGARRCSYCTVLLLTLLTSYTEAQWLIQAKSNPDLRIGFDPNSEKFDAYMHVGGRLILPHYVSFTGEPNTVTFELVDYPGRYLRHYYSDLYFEYNDNQPVFLQDATFRIHVNRFALSYYSFESVNYPGYFIKHVQNRLSIDNNTNTEEITFRFLKENVLLEPRTTGMCSGPRCRVTHGLDDKAYLETGGELFNMLSPAPDGRLRSVCFEDADRSGYFLRDYAQFAFIEPSNTTRSTTTYMQDTSFYLRPNQFTAGYFAVESAKYNGRFMRAVNSQVKFSHQDGTTNFASEVSFRIVEGPVYLESYNQAGSMIGLNEDDQAILSETGTRWNIIYKGLGGHPVTISLESYDRPGYYLRHYESTIDLEDINDPINPGIFNQDGTFLPRKDVWFIDCLILESVNYRDHFVRHLDGRMTIAVNESTDDFRQSASFKIVAAPIDSNPDGPGETNPGSNAGAIVGGIIGVLLLVALIVGAIFLDRKYNWTGSVKTRFQNATTRGESSDETSGGIENPTYPEETATNTPKPESLSSVTSSTPTTPTTPTGDPFNDSGYSTISQNPVKRLGRRLSDSMSKLRRSSSRNSTDGNSGDARRMEMPESFDLSVRDFQPGFERDDSKGSFDNPMYGLKRMSQVDGTEEEPASPPPDPSMIPRQDSLIDSSPTLAGDFGQAMSFYDQTIHEAATEDEDLGSTGEGESQQPTATDSGDSSKKKITAGIKPITDDDLWDITDA